MAPMGWMRQVRHVAGKDIRGARWNLLAFVALAAVATAFGMAGGDEALSRAGLATVLTLFSGLILAAVLVQADPPTRDDAFWAGTPLLPTAVLGAKLLLSLGTILGVLLLGHFAVVATYKVPTGEIAALLWHWTAVYGTWIFVVLVFAAVFRTLTSVVLGSVLIFIAGPFLLLFALAPLPEPVFESVLAGLNAAGPALHPVMVGGGYLLLSHLYRSRDERRRWVITGCALAVGSGVLLGPTSMSGEPERKASLPDRSELEGVVPSIEDIRYRPGETGPLSIRMTVRSNEPTGRYRIVPESARLIRADGSAEEVPIVASFGSGKDEPPRSAATTWTGEQRHGPAGVEVSLQLDASDWGLVRTGQSKIEVASRVEVLEPRRVAVLPVEAGAKAAGRGTWIEISGITERAGDVALRMSTRTLEVQAANGPLVDRRERRLNRGYVYALVHEERGEGIPLMVRGGAASHGSPFLPGSSLERSAFGLGMRGDAAGPSGPEWLREARLYVFEWVPVGSRQFAVRAQVRPVIRRPS